MDAFKHCPIDLNERQVIEFTRQAIGEVLEAWEMEYDVEPRDDLKTAGTLLNLHWKAKQARAEGTDLPDEDARLSAAAPSLLAALERLVEAVDPAVGSNVPLEDWALGAVVDARVAIAKATAKEPQA